MGLIQARNAAKTLWEKYVGNLEKTNPEAIAKKIGVNVLYENLEDEISGVLVVKDDTPVIFVNSTHHSNRQRFTIAHELGHHILHKPTGVHVDKGFTLAFRSPKSSTGEDLQEIEANQFAAELLMPREGIEKYLAKYGVKEIRDFVVEELATFFEVSQQAMTIRLNALGKL